MGRMAKVHVDLDLRWADQDAYGHINNVTFARYLEEARVRVFWTGAAREDTGLEQHFRADLPGGFKMLVANMRIDFVRVLNYSTHPITVAVWIGRLGGSSLDVHYEVIDNSGDEPVTVAKAITTIVTVDGETLRPKRLSDEGRRAVQPWQDEPLNLTR